MRELVFIEFLQSMEYNWDGVVWAPCIENTADPVVEGRTYDRLKNGEYNQVPLLTGFNSNEFRVIFDPGTIIPIVVKNWAHFA